MRGCRAIVSRLARVASRDKYLEGGWYGNDTLCRTILDLNRIQFGVRENTASSRQHAPRLSVSPWFHQSCVTSRGRLRNNRSMQWMSRSGGTFRFALSEGEERATGEVRRGANYVAQFVHSQGLKWWQRLGVPLESALE